MDSSDNRKIMTAYSHHHHQCLKLSPDCPQHAAYLLPPNTHHHLQLSPVCPLHRHLLLPPCPLHTSNNQSFPITPNYPSTPLPQNIHFNPIPPEAEDKNEEKEEEFIYVLTDEWKDFFAKSEAKRRLAKKQAKKKGRD